MIKFFTRLFKKEPEFDYVIAAYEPVVIDRFHMEVHVTEYEPAEPQEADEMTIDNIYQRN